MQPQRTSRRSFVRSLSLSSALLWLSQPRVAWAKTFLTLEQAQETLWGDEPMTPIELELTREQASSIRRASRVRVRNRRLHIWRTESGGWFIFDTVIGKHENIDLAIALHADGSVKGIEILVYRETYGHEIMNPRWLAQFFGRTHETRLRLDREIKNIAGATLSCRHVTDGINRITQTWEQVLRHVPADD